MQAAGAALLFPAWAARTHAETDTVPNLRAISKTAGLLFGSDSDVDVLSAPPAYATLLSRHCNLFAPNVSWSSRSPTSSDPGPDRNIDFARAQRMLLTGGHLLWHESVPAWFDTLESRQEAERAATLHITSLGTRYAGQVFSWNVVNEALNPAEGRADGLRHSALLRQLGPDFFEPAFQAARQADPKALLMYNDYGMELDSPQHAARRKALLVLIDRLATRSVPIDGVGLQSHLRLDGMRFDADIYHAFLKEIAAHNLKIILTELDVLDLVADGDIPTRDANAAAIYGAFLETALSEPAVKAVVSWGLSDRYSWPTAGLNSLAPTAGPTAHWRSTMRSARNRPSSPSRQRCRTLQGGFVRNSKTRHRRDGEACQHSRPITLPSGAGTRTTQWPTRRWTCWPAQAQPGPQRLGCGRCE